MEASAFEELPPWAVELVDDCEVGRLGFLDDRECPRVLPVTYAEWDAAIWSAIDQKPKRPGEPARVRYLRRRPAAALTIDRYSTDWDRLAWVQILGTVRMEEIGNAPGAVAALTAKYAQYERDPPPGPLLRLVPERILCWAADTRIG